MQKEVSSKTVRERVRRAAILPARYGFGAARLGRRIEQMVAFMDRWEFRPTIPVTASVLDRHPSVVRSLRGADLAIHGYHHRSYASMDTKQQAADLDAAISAFGRRGLVAEGFRAPYLAPGPATSRLLRSRRFVYDSSIPEFYLTDREPISDRAKKLAVMRYGRLTPVSSRKNDGSIMTELPVALPDDEILVDGLGIRSPSTLTRILRVMTDRALASARHLVLQVHPERFHIFAGALDSVLEKATEDGAWKTSLSDAAAWMVSGKSQPGNWPNGGPYAVSVTGDLDALSLSDFATRVLVT